MSKRFFEGIVYVVTPVQITDFDDKTRMLNMPVFASSGKVYIPYVPGNDIRGRMRRQGAAGILDVVKPVNISLYQLLNCGSRSTVPDGGSDSVKYILMARDDLYLGVFGGGQRLAKSGMQVRSMVPVNMATIQVGMVPEEYIDEIQVYATRAKGDDGELKPMKDAPHCTHSFTFTKVDDVLRCNDMNAPNLIENYETDAVAYAQSVNEEGGKIKAEKKSAEQALAAKRKGEDVTIAAPEDKTKKTSLGNMIKVEAIVPGTPMYLRIDFDDFLTDAQVFFAAHTLAEVFNGAIGGWGRVGFGRMKPNKMKYINGKNTPLFVCENGVYAANPALPGSEAAMEALAAYTKAHLNILFNLDGTGAADNSEE